MSSENGPELLNLESIYLSNGQNKADWDLFFTDINNESNFEKIVLYLKNKMKEDPKNVLTVDIIDYIVDNGNPKIIDFIFKKDLLDPFLNLLKSETNAGIENQKKVIYLTQKWAKKFGKNQNYGILIENYNLLKNSGICFPPENFVIETYTKYTGNSQSQTNKMNQNNQNRSNNQNNNFNNNQL